MNRKTLMQVVLFTLLIGLLAVNVPGLAQDTDELDLADNGDYFIGRQTLTFTDDLRPDRTISVEIWYPAMMPDDLSDRQQERFAEVGMDDAEPDFSAAPYPLVIYSHGARGQATEGTAPLTILASWGFVGVSIQHLDREQHEYVDRPLDIIAVVDGLAAMDAGDFVGLMDTENVGVMGFSAGAFASMQMIGLMTDLPHFVSYCADHSDLDDCQFLNVEVTQGKGLRPCQITLYSLRPLRALRFNCLLASGMNSS